MGSGSHHIVPFSVYVKIFLALCVGTVLTVGAHYVHFGALNDLIAVFIATVKAVLVLSFFMHLKYDGMLNRVIIGSAFFFLIVLYFFSRVDISTRIHPVKYF